MNNYLLSALTASPADAWEITESTTEGWEFYFIRHKLDQHRAKQVTHTSVKVYRKSEDGAFLGSASSEIQETASQSEVSDRIAALLEQAALVKNPVYTLHSPAEGFAVPAQDVPSVEDMASDFIRAMQEIPETEGEDINSYEIFVNVIRRHFLSSAGIDLTETMPSSMIEVVVNARRDGHEIELYRNYVSGTCDREGLKNDLIRTLTYGRDRLRTVPTPPLSGVDVVLSTDAAANVYDYFVSRMMTSMKYQRLSDWEVGDKVCDVPLTVTALQSLPNSSQNHLFDAEGAPIRDLVLIKDGIASAFHGPRQYSAYLGLEDAFIAYNFSVTGGSEDEEALRSDTCLEVVEFSDFQVDPMTGDIAGEIRLGYLYDEKGVTPVSGGSVSGNMHTVSLRLSSTQRQYDTFLIPALTRLSGLSITGIQTEGN